ncbi:hypothetical protein [Pseudoalteromonas sp. B62]|uniref:hypothetical protein n=1 Tax=Pseudoalteromonas sp. B62 TaxID=630483 RepID=UPI00301E4C65
MRLYKLAVLSVLASGCLSANESTIPLNEIALMDRQSLIEIFKESPTVEIEVNLTFNEIGSDKEDLLKKITAKPLPNFEGLTFSVSNKQQYLSKKNNLISTQPICKAGLVSAGKTVYKKSKTSALELIHSCGTSGCGYDFKLHLLPAKEVCKVL